MSAQDIRIYPDTHRGDTPADFVCYEESFDRSYFRRFTANERQTERMRVYNGTRWQSYAIPYVPLPF